VTRSDGSATIPPSRSAGPATVTAEAARRDPATPVGELAGPPPLAVGTGETAADALARLDDAHAAHTAPATWH
jgi:hypothetical protein